VKADPALLPTNRRRWGSKLLTDGAGLPGLTAGTAGRLRRGGRRVVLRAYLARILAQCHPLGPQEAARRRSREPL